MMEAYSEAAQKLFLLNNMLRSVFPDCPFMASTLNLGPKTVTKEHRDGRNLGFGLCCIMVFGNFDHRQGGHLKLKEPNVTMEVAPGCAVFIPSAIVTHSNTPIGETDKRYSLTLYSAGSLFLWVDNDGQKLKSLPPHRLLDYKSSSEKRWRAGWKLYRTWSS